MEIVPFSCIVLVLFFVQDNPISKACSKSVRVDKLAAKIVGKNSGFPEIPVNLGMELEKFRESLQNRQPDPGYNIYLQALWYDAKGDWEKSHELIQDLPDQQAARLHAYLHRKEGDQPNAHYWYRRAGSKMPAVSLEREWELLVSEMAG